MFFAISSYRFPPPRGVTSKRGSSIPEMRRSFTTRRCSSTRRRHRGCAMKRTLSRVAILPDGTRLWLLRINDWNFHWQDAYRYVTPIALPAGTTVAMEYTYDNSVENRRNPHRPPRHVTYGQRTDDEMGDLWIQ